MNSEPRKPDMQFSAGNIFLSIWENPSEINGRSVTDYSISVKRRYCDANGTWQTSETMFGRDMSDLELVARKAHEFVALRERGSGDNAA